MVCMVIDKIKLSTRLKTFIQKRDTRYVVMARQLNHGFPQIKRLLIWCKNGFNAENWKVLIFKYRNGHPHFTVIQNLAQRNSRVG